jgi:hypothetical protein
MKRMTDGEFMWHTRKHAWPDRPDFWEANDGYGMCNTGSGKRTICSFDGIGCDVDHALVKVRNLERAS